MVDSGQSTSLGVEIDRNQHHLSHAMLCLAGQVRSDKDWIGLLVRDDQRLAGAGGHVDADPGRGVIRDHHFGGRDKLIPRTEITLLIYFVPYAIAATACAPPLARHFRL
jgi:hypothetical protein